MMMMMMMIIMLRPSACFVHPYNAMLIHVVGSSTRIIRVSSSFKG
jgi:hypothetical protein